MNNDENTVSINEEMSEDIKGGNVTSNLWKKVTFGTTTGILLGAGAIQGVNHFTANHNGDTAQGTGGSVSTEADATAPVYGDAPVAHVSDSISFDQAFASARAEVGPGGAFAWHGGIYGTYYETEWDAMSDEQRVAYTQSVHPEIAPQHVHVSQINEAHPDVVVDVKVTDSHETQSHHNDALPAYTDHSSDSQETFVEDNDDVHIVGQGDIQGHGAVALDMSGNYEADVVIIDIDDSNSLTDPDVVVFRGGMATTIGDIEEGNPPVSLIGDEHQVGMENPDVAPDMPDYMDDANIPT